MATKPETEKAEADANLEAQIEALRRDVKELADALTQVVGTRVHEAGEQVRHRLDAAGEVGARMAGEAGQKARESVQWTQESIRSHPLISAMVALGVGFIIGMASRRNGG